MAKPSWYYDSINGLLPCRVLEITGKSGLASTAQRVRLKISYGSRRGEIVECFGLHLVPRHAVRRNRIIPYELTVTELAGN